MSGAKNLFRKSTVAVVGGGLAGMAAAVALRERGFGVELFEGQKRLGGRAGSFFDPEIHRPVDFSQHVSMGCCINLADFCRRIGAAECFRRYGEFHFFGPDGTQCRFASSSWLPAPLHLVPGLMRLRYLTLGERLKIARTMRRLAKCLSENVLPSPRLRGEGPGVRALDRSDRREAIGQWLRRQGESDRAIERFWSPVLVSALSETLDRASPAAAQKVFVDGFLASRRAYELEVPQVPLDEIFNRRAAGRLREHGVQVHLGRRVSQIDGNARRAAAIVLSGGTRRQFDFVVVAVPWHRAGSLFSHAMLSVLPELAGAQNIRPAPITAVHLWFDRPITRLPHAVLIGKMSQWVFNSGSSVSTEAETPGHYCQVVISASHELAGRSRRDVLAEVQRDLQAVWPDAGAAGLLHWRIATQAAAVFSVRPGLDRFRPAQQTPIENLMLAGDWTATGWPATMEGAVRSGYLAAEGVLRRLGSDERVLVPDLRRSRLSKMLFP